MKKKKKNVVYLEENIFIVYNNTEVCSIYLGYIYTFPPLLLSSSRGFHPPLPSGQAVVTGLFPSPGTYLQLYGAEGPTFPHLSFSCSSIVIKFFC